MNKILKKINLLVLEIIEIFTIGSLIWQIILKQYIYVGLCFMISILLLLPRLLEKRINIPMFLQIVINIFLFLAIILGEVWHLYIYCKYFDIIVHTIYGFLSVIIGLSLILFNKNIFKNISFKTCLLAICFSMTTGLFFEFLEYGTDKILKTDHQKDSYVRVISSVNLDKSKNGKPVIIKNIDKTVLYDKYDKELAVFESGYLDIGLKDTMGDLLANFIGSSLFFNIYYFLNIKKQILKGLIITKKN